MYTKSDQSCFGLASTLNSKSWFSFNLRASVGVCLMQLMQVEHNKWVALGNTVGNIPSVLDTNFHYLQIVLSDIFLNASF
jgi:hypothetical protein